MDNLPPPTSKPPLRFEVIVCGGGPAGICAAVAAAEAGRRTLLIEAAGRLGGTGVNALVNQVRCWTDTPYVQRFLDRLGGYVDDSEFLDLRDADLVQEAGAEILLHATVGETLLQPSAKGGRWPTVVGVRLATPSGPLTVEAERVVDASGDGFVAFRAGAAFDCGRPEDGLMQPATIMFRVGGVDHPATMEARGGRGSYRFPDGSTWDQLTMAACARGELPPEVGKVRTYPAERQDERYINATQINHIDGTDPFELTHAELEGRRQVPVIMDFLRRHAPGFADAYVSLMPAAVGIRETRRFRGLRALCREDCLTGRRWDDAVVTGCRAPLDVHNPDGPGQAEGVSKEHPAGRDPQPRKPYDTPYGCLVPEAVDSLLLAGRCISGDHSAHASYRWQSLCMATGAAAGFAAAASLDQNVQPRDLDIRPVQNALGIVRPQDVSNAEGTQP
ncbi:MAG: FAD-dependent oxidoreductase [Candidatus Brocadiia bacterium]